MNKIKAAQKEEKSNLVKRLHYNGGFSFSEISEMTGIPFGSIGSLVHYVKSETPTEKELLEAKVLDMKAKGLTLSDTAKVCEISEKRVQSILDKKIGSHRYVDTVYPAVTVWMNGQNLLAKDIWAYTAKFNNGNPVPMCQVNNLLEGRILINETTVYNRRCHSRTAIIHSLEEMSGMTFNELFKEKSAIDINLKSSKSHYKGGTYAAIDKWIKDEQICLGSLAALSGVCPSTVYHLLEGKIVLDKNQTIGLHSYASTQRVVDTILTLSGMEYEEAFAEIFTGTVVPVATTFHTPTVLPTPISAAKRGRKKTKTIA